VATQLAVSSVTSTSVARVGGLGSPALAGWTTLLFHALCASVCLVDVFVVQEPGPVWEQHQLAV
jgi:hypothetical protein